MRKAARVIVVKDDALLVMHRNKFGQEYYTLIGGALKAGEAADAAALREVQEETGLHVGRPRLVFIEEAGEPFGTQYVFLCDYQGGEVALPADSEEMKIHELGQNLYTPTWLPVRDLPDAPFVSPALKAAVIDGLLRGFPATPLAIRPA